MDLYSYQNLILFVVRVALGVTFIKHGWPKIKNPLGMKDWLKSMSFPLPGFLSVIVAVVEFFGGILVLIGFYAETAALLIVIDMGVAAVVRKFKQKDKWLGGYELDLALMSLALILALYGTGDWALGY